MNINIIAPLNQLGYGIAGQNVSLALKKAGAAVALFPIGPIDVAESSIDDIEEMKANSSEYDYGAPCLRIWHQDQMAEHVGYGMRIGFPFFELDRFNKREKHHMNSLHKIFVASKWAKKIVMRETNETIGENNIHVIPLGVDRSIFNENVTAHSLEPDHTVFLNVGKWERRKGHDVLLSAFCKAFTPSDKVSLHMACYNPFIGGGNEQWAKRYLGSSMGRNIIFLPRLTTQKLLTSVLAKADCAVFPARAEGWNLDLLEIMSMGKNVICTNNTGHTEFVDQNNARLISCDKMEPAEDGVWFHGQGNWYSLGADQEEQLINHMREVHRLKQTGQLNRNDAGIETAKMFNWDNTAQQIINALTNY